MTFKAPSKCMIRLKLNEIDKRVISNAGSYFFPCKSVYLNDRQ